jgi:membrane dipeptidase
VFDGHNDALTRPDHAGIASGRPDGHLDLARMRAGGMRGGIFAVCAPPGGVFANPVPRDDGVVEFALPDPIPYPEAAGFAARAAGRLMALERDGQVRIGRTVRDLDATAADAEAAPVTVLHLEGAEAIDPGLESPELWHAAGLRSVGPVWSRPTAFGHGVPFAFPSSPDTGPGLTPAGRALVRRCAQLGIMIDLSHLNEAGFWDVSRAEVGARGEPFRGARAFCGVSEPDGSSA